MLYHFIAINTEIIIVTDQLLAFMFTFAQNTNCRGSTNFHISPTDMILRYQKRAPDQGRLRKLGSFLPSPIF